MRLSEIPFCNTFCDPVKAVLFAPGVEEAVLDAAFGVRAGFFVGDIAFPVLAGDFPSDRRDFADVLPTRGTEGLLPVLDADSDNVPATLEREISLLAESLLCLSINGDLAVVVLGWRPSRGLAAPLDVGGAVLGLVDALVIGCLDVADVLAVVPADVDLGGFDVRLDTVDGNDLTAPSVVLVVVVLALAGLAATFPVLVSPRFVAGFFSVDVAALNLEEAALVVLIFDFVVPTRDEAPVFAVVVVVVVLDDVGVLVLVTLLLVLEIPVALVDASTSCLGRAAIGFFAGTCDGDDIAVVRVVVEVTIFEGDVGVFVAVFVVGFVGRLVVVVVVAFALVAAAVAIAETACIASAVPCSFNSSVFATSSGDAFAISCGLASSSLFTRISSGAICFSGISWTFVDSICTANSSSTCFCTIGALLNNVQDGFIIG